jgi:hypothetical protein
MEVVCNGSALAILERTLRTMLMVIITYTNLNKMLKAWSFMTIQPLNPTQRLLWWWWFQGSRRL